MLGFRCLQGCFKGCQFILGYLWRGLLDHLQEPLHLLRLIRISNVLSCSSTGWALGIDNQGAPRVRKGMKWERVRAAQPYEPFTGARILECFVLSSFHQYQFHSDKIRLENRSEERRV